MSHVLDAISVFVKVVQTGSFTAAARALDVPKSTASQRVSELERHLGARLLQRTTRQLSLTDQGRIYFEHCLRILAEVEDAERAVVTLQDQPRGRLRLTVPASAQFLAPVFADFLKQHGETQLEVVCTDRFVNLVEESFDLAIRAGTLADSSLVARSLGAVGFVMVASPRYLKKRGRPRSPAALSKHACLVFGAGHQPRRWRLTDGDDTAEIDVTPVLEVNDFDILQASALGAVGIAMLPAYRCTADLEAGRLERVLPTWRAPSAPFQAVYPSGRHLSPKVKAMLEVLRRFTPTPWERGSATPAARA